MAVANPHRACAALALIAVAGVVVMLFADGETTLMQVDPPTAGTAAVVQESSKEPQTEKIFDAYKKQTSRITHKYQHNIEQLVSSETKANEALKSSGSLKMSKTVAKDPAIATRARKSSHPVQQDDPGEAVLVELLAVPPAPQAAPAPDAAAAQQAEQARQQKKQQKEEAAAADKLRKKQQKEQEEAEKKKEKAQKKLANGVRLKNTGLQKFKDVIIRSTGRVKRKMSRAQAHVYDTVRRGIHHMEESPGGQAAIHAARHIREGVFNPNGMESREEVRESNHQLKSDISRLRAKTASEEKEIDELRSDTDNTLLQSQYESMLEQLNKETAELTKSTRAEDAKDLKEVSDYSEGKGPNPFVKDGNVDDKVAAEAKAADALGHAASELGKGTKEVKPEPEPKPSTPSTSKVLDRMASTRTLSDIDNMHDFTTVHATLVKENDAEAKAKEAASQGVKAQADSTWEQTQAAAKANEEPLAARDAQIAHTKNWKKIYDASSMVDHSSGHHKMVAKRMHLLHPDEPATGDYGAQGIPRKYPEAASSEEVPRKTDRKMP